MVEITDIIEHTKYLKTTDRKEISSGIKSWDEHAMIEEDIIKSTATYLHTGYVLGRDEENSKIYICPKLAKLSGEDKGRYVTSSNVEEILVKNILKYDATF